MNNTNVNDRLTAILIARMARRETQGGWYQRCAGQRASVGQPSAGPATTRESNPASRAALRRATRAARR